MNRNLNPAKFHGKPVSQYDLIGLGINQFSLRMVKDLEELRKNQPNIVIAEAEKNIWFSQNKSRTQHLVKRNKYVMGLGTFQQLQFDARLPKVKLLKPASVKFSNIYKPYFGQDLTNKTILVWRTGGIGDLLFIQPNLIYLKEKYPTCKILFACGPQYQSMLETWDFIDEVLDLPFSFTKLLNSDYHVIFEGVIERTKEGETTNAYRLFTKWMGLNLPDEKLVPTQNPKKELVDKSMNILKDWNLSEKGFILLQLKASSPIRTPSFEVWKKIVELLIDDGNKIVITDGKHNNEFVESFIKILDTKYKNQVFNFAPYSDTLDNTIALCKLAKLVVGTDSSMIHISASLGVKSFGIYGPFPGDIRLDTYPNCDWIDCKKECAPCFTHGQDPCRNSKDGYSLCYSNIDLNEFMTKVKNLLNKKEDLKTEG